MDINYNLDQYCNSNVNGVLKIQNIHENKAKQMADLYGLKMTLRRLPHITNFD